jgi:hypothetical protein
LYRTAFDVVHGGAGSERRFIRSMQFVARCAPHGPGFYSNPVPTSGESPQHTPSYGALPSRLPFPMPGGLIDLCRLERWNDTAEASRCFRRLREGPRYSISDIVNLTREEAGEPVGRRGCAGDLIEIRGDNLGDSGTLEFETPRGLVVVTEDWRDDRIRFEVPERARSGDLSLCINPGIPECVRFGACRLAESDTDHSFEVVQPPEIARFEASGSTVVSVAENTVEAEGCTNVQLIFQADEAERVRLLDGSGEPLWDSGEGSPRRITNEDAGEASVVSLSETETYTLEVTNLCDTIRQELTVRVYHALHLTASSARIRSGEDVTLEIRSSCPAPEGGIAITLTSDSPDALPAPSDPTLIPAGSDNVSVTLASAAPCSEATVRAEAPDHRTDSDMVLIYGAPVIRDVSPLRVTSCSPFTLSIEGDCFDPELGDLQVHVTDGSERRRLDIRDIRFNDAADRGHDAVLEVGGDGLLPGEWRLSVTSFGLETEWPGDPLVVAPAAAIIHSFSVSPSLITPCVATTVELTWEVENARQVNLTGDGFGPETRRYPPSCGRRTDSITTTVTEAQTFQLQAQSIGGGPGDSASTNVSERSVPQANQVLVRNRTIADTVAPDGHTITVWKFYLATCPGGDLAVCARAESVGTIEAGENLEVDLEDCTPIALTFVSHQWIDDWNRRHPRLAVPGPHDQLTAATSNFWETLTPLDLLGRDGAGLYIQNLV